MLPIIKSEAIERNKWITSAEFDQMVSLTNMLPGPSTIQSITFIAHKFYSWYTSFLLVLIASLPHLILALTVVILIAFIPKQYLYIIMVMALMPVISGLSLITYRYFKKSKETLKISLWVPLMTFSVLYSLFVPMPFNLPIFAFIWLFLFVLIYTFFVYKKKKKVKNVNIS